MGPSRGCMRVCVLLLYLTTANIFFTHCDARRFVQPLKRPRHPKSSGIRTSKKLKFTKHLDIDPLPGSTNAQTYSMSSPFSLPPFESLGPMPLPENAPPYCSYPPNTPESPSTVIPSPTAFTPSLPAPPPPFYYLPPVLPSQSPPPGPASSIPGTPQFNPTPNPPITLPGTPGAVPSPFIYIPTPPSGFTLSPPFYEPSPPSYVPSPTVFVPSPPVFEPPVVFPPPTGPPSPTTGPSMPRWCVAKPAVPDPIIQEAMDYACWSGADCTSIQPDGTCFQPNSLLAHASYAFNSYWQKTRAAGGTCDFGGTAIIVTVDPSHDGCHFDLV